MFAASKQLLSHHCTYRLGAVRLYRHAEYANPQSKATLKKGEK